ncbi:hypothetical protein LSTR_LSTR008408 [Laodelphax striatellus]|uniref:RNA-binding motif protein, X-linked 2 n=1 Tax=Laodelphax striatellus TaxID=195883 RepID=A0A482XSZ2_LAOST|nr:hypothetical protein LSTR_LSTR008408 [Laodelphax striatellus]
MNPMTNVKNIKKLSEQELTMGLKTSWHDQYKGSAWIFIGGLPYDLTEGDVLCIFSQYGEIVNINLVRDKATGKQKGFCFICYEDQRSTNLAVDNLNAIKILGRTIRVDHVADYKAPKDIKIEDPEMERLRKEGCAPSVQPPLDITKIKKEPDTSEIKLKKVKKEKKEKKKKSKKKNKATRSSSPSSSDSSPTQSKNKKSTKRSYSSDDSDSESEDERKTIKKNKKKHSMSSESEDEERPRNHKLSRQVQEETRVKKIKKLKKNKRSYESDSSDSSEHSSKHRKNHSHRTDRKAR